MATRAIRLWKKTLAEFEAPALDEAKDEELKDYVTRTKASRDDAWY